MVRSANKTVWRASLLEDLASVEFLALDVAFPEPEVVDEFAILLVFRVQFLPLVRLVVNGPIWAQL